MRIQEIRVPDIGQFSHVEIIEIPVQVGSEVQEEETLITLETEKASMDVPVPIAGVIKEMKVKVGDKVSKGDVIAFIEVMQDTSKAVSGEVATDISPTNLTAELTKEEGGSQPAFTEDVKLDQESVAEEVVQNGTILQEVHAGPATRRLARECGVDLTLVQGTGIKNRIISRDVTAYVKARMQACSTAAFGIGETPEIDFTQFGEIELKPLSRIKKWTAKNLHRNWISIPHVTQFDEADITELEHFRQENMQEAKDRGIKVTPLAFVIKAVISALKFFPQFNSSLAVNGAELIYKKYYNIGIAVDTPQGLVVPVIKNAERKGLLDLAKELGEVSGLAREGKLASEQMQGSCFTITSLGGIGGTQFTPIINAPDVAILGISKAQIKPIYKEKKFVPRRMLPLSLSYDHRVIDGVEAARFITHISAQLQDIRKLLY